MSINEKTIKKSLNKIKKPKLYKVLLHNDNYTTMEFVIQILINIFEKKFEEATTIMYNIHNNGIGIAGIYSYDIATSKVEHVKYVCKEHKFPLKVSIEDA